MKEYWTITYHDRKTPDFLELTHKDLSDKYLLYQTVNYLPDFFKSKYEIDFVMILHKTKTVRIFMKDKEEGGTV